MIKSSTCIFSYTTYLISYITCLNNTCRWFYKLPSNELEEILLNQYRKNLYLGGYGFNLDMGLEIVVGEE